MLKSSPAFALVTANMFSFISSDDGHSSVSFGDDMHSSSLSALAVHQFHQRQKSDLSSPRPISEPSKFSSLLCFRFNRFNTVLEVTVNYI